MTVSRRRSSPVRGCRPAVVLVAALALAGLGSIVVHTQAQTPQFRGGATLVYVDVYPRLDGKIVEGLTAADFEVAEGGRTHAIENFQFISVRQNVPDEERRDPSTQTEALRQVADPTNRVFLVYLDIDHTTAMGSHAAQQPIVDFLTRTISSTDLFAVATAEMSLQRLTFGRRTETIADELRRYWAWGEGERLARIPRNETEARLGQCLVNQPDDAALELLLKVFRDDRMFTNLEDLLPHLRALREGRKNIVLVSEGWVPEGPQSSLLTLIKGVPPSPIGTLPSGRLGRVADQPGSIDYSWCDGQIGRLAAIDFEQRYRDLLRDVRRSNVTFYPIDVGGLRTPAGADASIGTTRQAAAADRRQFSNMETLRELASATDGYAVVNTNDLSGAVRRVSDMLAGYYLLGYAPTDQRADGRFREIRVRVKRPNVDVSARLGYFAPSAADRAAMTAAAATAAARPAVDASVSSAIDALSRARTDAELMVHAARRPGAIEVVVELGAAAMTSGRSANGGEVQVTARLTGAPPATVTAKFDAGARSTRVTLPVGALASTDLAAPIAIEARLAGQGGPAVTTQLSATTGKMLGEPLLFRATPSPRSVPRPTADPQYRRTERLHIECPVGVDVQVAARLLDARGQPLPVTPTVTLTGDGADRMAAADVNLSALAEGSYLVELSADTAGERRLVAFRVVR